MFQAPQELNIYYEDPRDDDDMVLGSNRDSLLGNKEFDFLGFKPEERSFQISFFVQL